MPTTEEIIRQLVEFDSELILALLANEEMDGDKATAHLMRMIRFMINRISLYPALRDERGKDASLEYKVDGKDEPDFVKADKAISFAKLWTEYGKQEFVDAPGEYPLLATAVLFPQAFRRVGTLHDIVQFMTASLSWQWMGALQCMSISLADVERAYDHLRSIFINADVTALTWRYVHGQGAFAAARASVQHVVNNPRASGQMLSGPLEAAYDVLAPTAKALFVCDFRNAYVMAAGIKADETIKRNLNSAAASAPAKWRGSAMDTFIRATEDKHEKARVAMMKVDDLVFVPDTHALIAQVLQQRDNSDDGGDGSMVEFAAAALANGGIKRGATWTITAQLVKEWNAATTLLGNAGPVSADDAATLRSFLAKFARMARLANGSDNNSNSNNNGNSNGNSRSGSKN